MSATSQVGYKVAGFVTFTTLEAATAEAEAFFRLSRKVVSVEEVAIPHIRVGDRVRSFDFEGRTNCFVEGVVLAIVQREGCPRYEIAVESDVFDGEAMSGEHKRRVCYPPVNGTRKVGGGVCNCVVIAP